MPQSSPRPSGTMIAIDTNIVVRLLTGDDPDQARRARALIESNRVFVALTVMLESEWVLRSAYGFDRHRVMGALTAFAGLEAVVVERPNLLAEAMRRCAAGMDFADALHLGAAEGCEAFVTFDRRFASATNDEFVRQL